MWTLLLAKKTGLNLIPVPYKGAADMTTAIIRGDCKLLITNATVALNAQVAAGTLRILGITSEKRSTLSPDIPLVTATVPGFVIAGWFGFIGSATLSLAAADTISSAVKVAVAEPGVREKLATMYMEPSYRDRKAFSTALQETNEFYKQLVVEIGVAPI